MITAALLVGLLSLLLWMVLGSAIVVSNDIDNDGKAIGLLIFAVSFIGGSVMCGALIHLYGG